MVTGNQGLTTGFRRGGFIPDALEKRLSKASHSPSREKLRTGRVKPRSDKMLPIQKYNNPSARSGFAYRV